MEITSGRTFLSSFVGFTHKYCTPFQSTKWLCWGRYCFKSWKSLELPICPVSLFLLMRNVISLITRPWLCAMIQFLSHMALWSYFLSLITVTWIWQEYGSTKAGIVSHLKTTACTNSASTCWSCFSNRILDSTSTSMLGFPNY